MSQTFAAAADCVCSKRSNVARIIGSLIEANAGPQVETCSGDAAAPVAQSVPVDWSVTGKPGSECEAIGGGIAGTGGGAKAVQRCWTG